MTSRPLIAVLIPFYVPGEAEAGAETRYLGTLGPWVGASSGSDPRVQRLRHLHLMLTSLDAQSLPHDDYEVVVVDDGSALDVAEVVESWGMTANVRVVRQEHRGFCSAYNSGLAATAAGLVFLAVDHDLLGPVSLEAHVEAHEAAGEPTVVSGRQRYLFHSIVLRDLTDPDAGVADLAELAVRPATSWVPAAVATLGLDRKGVTVSDVRDAFERLEWLASITEEYADVEETIRTGRANTLRCGWLAMRTGSNSLPRATLEAVGGFDAALDEHYGWYAEADLGLRLRGAGIPFRFAERALAVDLFHAPAASTGIGKSTGLAYLIGKHGTVDVALLPHYLDRVLGIEEYSRHAEAAARWWKVASGR